MTWAETKSQMHNRLSYLGAPPPAFESCGMLIKKCSFSETGIKISRFGILQDGYMYIKYSGKSYLH